MPKMTAPRRRRMIRGQVVRTERTSPSFMTVTVSGERFSDFEYMGYDQCFRLFFLRPGQTELRIPTANNIGWAAQFFLIPAKSRPYVRNYTVRAFRPEALELDIEFAVHGDRSPASRWAPRAAPGEPVGVYNEGIAYRPVDGVDWQLLVADESGLPAVLAILDRAPAQLNAEVFLEVPSTGDIRDITVPDGVHVHWLPRDDSHAIPGRRALAAVTEAGLPTGPSYSFIAGESGLATGLRRHLTTDRQVPKSHITFLGYWKHGAAGLG